MEPMNIGTPNNSGPSSPATTPGGSPYLPSFLLGEPQTPLSGSASPKSKRVSFIDSHTLPKDYIKHDLSNHFSQSSRTPTALNASQIASRDKGTGPPIYGLFDTINSPVSNTENQSNDVQSYVSAASKYYAEPRLSPTRHIDATDSNWVTVFGYPLSAASFILAQLSHCGNIIATRTPTKGNWMHIKYSSKLEARRALANNGKVFAGTVMIGVIPCRDQGVISECINDKENLNSLSFNAPSPIPSTPRNKLYPDLNGVMGVHPMSESSIYESPIASPGRYVGARPLQGRLNDTEVYSAGNTPQKNTGLVAKAMEYVFGW